MNGYPKVSSKPAYLLVKWPRTEMSRSENPSSLAKSGSERQEREGRCKTMPEGSWPLAPKTACMSRTTERHWLSFRVKC